MTGHGGHLPAESVGAERAWGDDDVVGKVAAGVHTCTSVTTRPRGYSGRSYCRRKSQYQRAESKMAFSLDEYT